MTRNRGTTATYSMAKNIRPLLYRSAFDSSTVSFMESVSFIWASKYLQNILTFYKIFSNHMVIIRQKTLPSFIQYLTNSIIGEWTFPNSGIKVSTVEDVAWQNSTLQIFICFHHIFVPFEKKNEKNSWLDQDSNPRPLDQKLIVLTITLQLLIVKNCNFYVQ